jgi:hypothetical protein
MSRILSAMDRQTGEVNGYCAFVEIMIFSTKTQFAISLQDIVGSKDWCDEQKTQ